MAPPPVADSTIQALNPQVLTHIFSYVGFRDCAAVACVQQSWKLLSEDDQLWQCLCEQDFHVHLLEGWDGKHLSTFKEVYKSWYLGFGKNRYGALLPRAKRCWDAILAWTHQHAPEIAATVAPGASEEDLDKLEARLGMTLPLAVRVVYRLHNGQGDESGSSSNAAKRLEKLFRGLFGGYSFYEHIACTRMAPVHELLLIGNQARGHHLVRCAHSFNHEKFFAVSMDSGQVYCGTRSGQHVGCCPPASQMGGCETASAGGASTSGRGGEVGAKDGMLRWMEEYARRLQEGWYQVKSLWEEGSTRSLGDADITRGISLYPEAGPAMAEAVTRGVRVRSSAIFIPEHSYIHPSDPRKNRFFFSYSIRLTYTPPEDSPSQSAPPTVQLWSRRWLIKEHGEVVDEVRGEGVIGKYPLLKPGEPEVVYQSCSSSTSKEGAMEGSLQFVPGSLVKPAGTEFDVKVEEFPLEVPEYIF